MRLRQRHAYLKAMRNIMISLITALAVALLHFSYVDFRFRYREGFQWFWMLNPAPPIMWFCRATAAAALIAALAGPFIGISNHYAYLVGGLFAVHIIGLILLEVLEPR